MKIEKLVKLMLFIYREREKENVFSVSLPYSLLNVLLLIPEDDGLVYS